MHLAVFDIDGTLIETSRRHDECFVEAVTEVLGEDGGAGDINWDWSDYTYVSDSGILFELFTKRRGHGPTEEETRRIQAAYRAALERDNSPNTPLPGAGAFLDRLDRTGWQVAIATGNWDFAARWKLRAAGIEPPGFAAGKWPMGTADDAMDRPSIIRAAMARAGGEGRHVVYLGDGDWDRRAAETLGIHFVHLGHEVHDYRDPDDVARRLTPADGTADR